MRGVGQLARAGRDEQLRHLVVVEILPDREVRRGAERVEQEGDLLLLDQPAHLLDGLGRAVGVVEAIRLILRPFTPPCSLIILK